MHVLICHFTDPLYLSIIAHCFSHLSSALNVSEARKLPSCHLAFAKPECNRAIFPLVDYLLDPLWSIFINHDSFGIIFQHFGYFISTTSWLSLFYQCFLISLFISFGLNDSLNYQFPHFHSWWYSFYFQMWNWSRPLISRMRGEQVMPWEH